MKRKYVVTLEVEIPASNMQEAIDTFWEQVDADHRHLSVSVRPKRK